MGGAGGIAAGGSGRIDGGPSDAFLQQGPFRGQQSRPPQPQLHALKGNSEAVLPALLHFQCLIGA